jgi:hypothetical protein
MANENEQTQTGEESTAHFSSTFQTLDTRLARRKIGDKTQHRIGGRLHSEVDSKKWMAGRRRHRCSIDVSSLHRHRDLIQREFPDRLID